MNSERSDHLASFQQVGRKLYEKGLIHGSSGNLSLRLNGNLLITTHNSSLARLTASDIIETGIYEDNAATPSASFELPVHRVIYQLTKARAVVHAHPPCAIALSLADNKAVLANAPVIGESTMDIIPGVLAGEVAGLLKSCPLVMVRGHGSFASGETLDEALRLTLAFEDECKNICKNKGLKPLSPSSEA